MTVGKMAVRMNTADSVSGMGGQIMMSIAVCRQCVLYGRADYDEHCRPCVLHGRTDYDEHCRQFVLSCMGGQIMMKGSWE